MGFDLPVMNRLRRSGRALSPASLFATGAQGVIYDPRDLSTMFQDDAGVTPVTAPGQVVGLRLDKSKNGIETNGLSRRNLLTQTEAFNEAVWIKASGAAITVNTDTAPDGTLTADTLTTSGVPSFGAGLITQAVSVAATGVTFTFSAYLKASSTNKATIWLNLVGGAERVAVVVSLTSSYQRYTVSATFTSGSVVYPHVVAGDANLGTDAGSIFIWGAQLEIGSAATLYQIITSSWVATIPGNHAVQATAGARLTYGIEPKTGTRNTLTQTEAFNSTVWTKTSVLTLTADATTAPDGTATADLITETATSGLPTARYTLATGVISGTYSVYAKANGRNHVCLSIYGGAAFKYSAAVYDLSTGAVTKTQVGTSAVLSATDMVSVGSGWYRLSMSYTITAPVVIDPYINLVNSATPTIDVYGTPAVYTGDGTSGTYLWGAQLETGAVATPYQKVVTAFEVTEAGIPTCHYCAYAGANSMATAAIDFTATDKVSFFAGIRKSSDATLGVLLEASATKNSNNGIFALYAPNANGSSDFTFYSKGTIPAAGSAAIALGFAAPVTKVVTGLGDIAGDLVTTRINGTQESQATVDQGTGNYGNHILYFGRRAGSTLPFTGRDYGIVIVGKATSAAEINITEAWLAANTPTVVL